MAPRQRGWGTREHEAAHRGSGDLSGTPVPLSPSIKRELLRFDFCAAVSLGSTISLEQKGISVLKRFGKLLPWATQGTRAGDGQG